MKARSLTSQELNVAITHALNNSGKWAQRNRLLLLVSHWTGMRVCEIASLRVRHVLDARGEVLAQIQLSVNETKGNQSRTVVLPSRLQTELRNYIRREFQRPKLAGMVLEMGHLPLFATQKRNAFTANTLTQTYSKLYRDAGISGATSHSGRRSFLTNLASSGANPRALQVLAGHRSLNTTMRYIDVNENVLRAVVEMI